MQQHTEGVMKSITPICIFFRNSLLFPALIEFWKSVKNWRSYRHEFGVLLFCDTVYNTLQTQNALTSPSTILMAMHASYTDRWHNSLFRFWHMCIKKSKRSWNQWTINRKRLELGPINKQQETRFSVRWATGERYGEIYSNYRLNHMPWLWNVTTPEP